MKKMYSLLLLIGLTNAVIFTGCKNDDDVDPKPNISVDSPSGDETTVAEGDSVDFVVTMSSDKELKKLVVEKNVDNSGNATVETITLNDKSYTYTKTLPSKSSTGTVVYTFTVTDKDDVSNSDSYTINVAGAVNSYTAVLLGNQSNNVEGSFYDAIHNVVYTQALAKANSEHVDFAFYHGATNGATIAAPDDAAAATIYNNGTTGLQTWTTLLSTRFKEVAGMSATDFAAITNDAIIEEKAEGANSSDATQLSVGKVYAFVTDSDHASTAGSGGVKKGLFRVTALTGTTSTSGSITFDVKVQQ